MNDIYDKGKNGLFGRLVEDVTLPTAQIDLLFLFMCLTSACAFLISNLMMLDMQVLATSTRIGAVCWGVLAVFYLTARTTRNILLGLMVAYFIVIVGVFVKVAIPVVLGALGIGFAGGLTKIVQNFNREIPFRLIAISALASAVFLVAQQLNYVHFDMLDRLHAGAVHKDTFFHASISAMIKNFGVVSTGLDGLVETPYYVMSHTLAAGISLLSGIPVLESYGVIPYVLWGPILLFAINALVACMGIRGQELLIAWIVTIVVLTLYPLLFQTWAVGISYLISESHLVALGLMLLGMPFLFKKKLSAADALLLFALVGVLAASKATVGVAFWGMWACRQLFLPIEGRVREAINCLLGLALAVAICSIYSTGANLFRFYPLHFIVYYTDWGGFVLGAMRALANGQFPIALLLKGAGAIATFMAFYFLLSWVVLWSERPRSLALFVRNPIALYVSAVTGLGIAVLALLAIPGGSAGYFSNISWFVALPFFIRMLVGLFEEHGGARTATVKYGRAIMLLSLLAFCGHYAFGMRSVYAGHRARDGSYSEYLAALADLRDPSHVNTAYRLGSPPPAGAMPYGACQLIPFIYPAITERPWTGVIGLQPDCSYQNYGYELYWASNGAPGELQEPRLSADFELRDWTFEQKGE